MQKILIVIITLQQEKETWLISREKICDNV